ncbi:unnamed protein product [Prorocentrum cordatum]|uniref:Methyltransferase domain-containing protein n=1 Tax=Prorocentrum cordatum TaxID=2364126 RepID=A0ABN9VMZ3_9DINO|nr:unnamed protein product [Polarella glacialis]
MPSTTRAGRPLPRRLGAAAAAVLLCTAACSAALPRRCGGARWASPCAVGTAPCSRPDARAQPPARGQAAGARSRGGLAAGRPRRPRREALASLGIEARALVEAIERGDEEEAASLLAGPRAPELLRARSLRGMTPLMLVGAGACSPGLAERMLALGAEAAGVSLRSHKGRTAADYAELHGRPELALRLRALMAQRLAEGGRALCGVCGVEVARRPKLHEVVARCSSGEERNALLVDFCTTRCGVVSTLLHPHFHPLNDDEKLRKKLTQSLGVLQALEQLVPDLDGWHVIDLCSGKSLTSTLVALQHPTVTVTAVDRLSQAHLPHWTEAGLDNALYKRLDVMAEDFMDQLANTVAASGRPVAVLGMHLCGSLSERAVEVFQTMPLVRACILSPCCLPPLHKAPPSVAPLYRTGAQDDEQYHAWCAHLERSLGAGNGVSVASRQIEEMLTIKSTVLSASKPPLSPAEAAEAAAAAAAAAARSVLPARLFVRLLFGTDQQLQCHGEYTLEASDSEQPVWRHVGEDRSIHLGADGLWRISDSSGEHFAQHPAAVGASARGPDTLPHEQLGAWERRDAKKRRWLTDGALAVTLTERRRKLSSSPPRRGRSRQKRGRLHGHKRALGSAAALHGCRTWCPT